MMLVEWLARHPAGRVRLVGPVMKLIAKKGGYSGFTTEYNGYNQAIRTVYRDTEWKP